MITTNPQFIVKVIEVIPLGPVKFAVKCCPRCGCNMGITESMRRGADSIICKGKLNSMTCNGHYILKGNKMEFAGTVR